MTSCSPQKWKEIINNQNFFKYKSVVIAVPADGLAPA